MGADLPQALTGGGTSQGSCWRFFRCAVCSRSRLITVRFFRGTGFRSYPHVLRNNCHVRARITISRVPLSRDNFPLPGLFQHSTEPLFLLTRRRRIRFVNHAWEQWAGLSLAQVKGLRCRAYRLIAHNQHGERHSPICCRLHPKCNRASPASFVAMCRRASNFPLSGARLIFCPSAMPRVL